MTGRSRSDPFSSEVQCLNKVSEEGRLFGPEPVIPGKNPQEFNEKCIRMSRVLYRIF